MGRWAQARKRGSGYSTAPAFPFSPPANGDVWTIEEDEGDPMLVRAFVLDITPPDGAGAVQFQAANVDPPVTGDTLTALQPGDNGDIFTALVPETVFVRARWVVAVLSPVPLSDWSAVVPIDIG